MSTISSLMVLLSISKSATTQGEPVVLTRSERIGIDGEKEMTRPRVERERALGQGLAAGTKTSSFQRRLQQIPAMGTTMDIKPFLKSNHFQN
ncbi:hypothetical protein AAHE18_01G094700 [Arachis hypogaea]